MLKILNIIKKLKLLYNNYMNNKEMKILDEELFDIVKIWQHQLHLEYMNPNKNVRISFKDIGSFGELLAISYNPEYVGRGSGGMGLDLVNIKTKKSIEVKSCCTIQNSKCSNKECGAKFNPLFHNKCPVCNSDGKEMNDSRFAINAKDFLGQYKEGKGFFDNFTLFHIGQISHHISNKKLSVRLSLYKINFNDREDIKNIKLDYFKTQAKKGKKPVCNLLPNQFDFYKLCPSLIDVIDIELDYSDMKKNPVIKHKGSSVGQLRVPITVLREKEKKIFKELSSYSPEDETADMIDFTKNISYRKKTHGKDRGDTRKNAYRVVT
jgi:hypothetical protein